MLFISTWPAESYTLCGAVSVNCIKVNCIGNVDVRTPISAQYSVVIGF